MRQRLLHITLVPLVVLAFVFALAFALSVGSADPAFAQAGTGVVRVAKTGADAPGCGSAAAPCATIQYAVDQALDGDEVRVAAGTYTGAQQVSAPRPGGVTTMTQVVIITKSLNLRGGYTPDNWDSSDAAQNETIIDAEGYGRGISIAGTGTQSVMVEGFTITGGDYTGLGNSYATAQCIPTNADCGGGLYARQAVVVIRGCVITGNVASQSFQSDGGGVFLYDTLGATRIEETVVANNRALGNNANGGGVRFRHQGDITISDCEFIGNLASDMGGAVDMFVEGDGLALIQGSEFIGNRVHTNQNGRGGAVHLSRGRAVVRDSTFISNTGRVGGALYGYTNSGDHAVAILERNVFFNNSANQDGGAVDITNNSVVTLTNNIIAQNGTTYVPEVRVGLGTRAVFVHNTIVSRDSGTPGDGVWVVQTGATAVFTNSIVVNHTNGIYASGAVTVSADYTLFFGNSSDLNIDGRASVVSTNEITGSAPMFVDADGWDYHLTFSSPAIDAGVDAGVTDDIDGDMRPQGNGFDIGADEYVGAPMWGKVYLPLVVR